MISLWPVSAIDVTDDPSVQTSAMLVVADMEMDHKTFPISSLLECILKHLQNYTEYPTVSKSHQ